ncbi:MAG: oligopeptide transporter, OPT family, partial [Lachnospiraceae bacterium]|nr:oligopeptide transporter, OPT family [Lachnospiraceae bacterium]
MNEENKKKEFKPVVPDNARQPEFTITSILLGIFLAVVFGGANAYLGLRVGMTISASIPAAVISMGVIRIILKKDSILENNMVQTIGSAGESLAAGAIFTLPAIFMWAQEGNAEMPSFLEITLLALSGGILGVLLMIPLRKALIVKEHDKLPYPEGTACAEVLLAGEKGGNTAKTVFQGLGFAAVYKFIADGIALFPSEVDFSFKKYKGAGFGGDVLPALVGVGYICGIKVSSFMFAGGILAWFALMPAISLFGGGTILYPADVPISEMSTWSIWSSYIRYIGAGAVATGGIISLIKSFPMIMKTFIDSMASLKNTDKIDAAELDENGKVKRTFLDIPTHFVLIGVVVIALIMWLVPIIPVDFIGALFIILFGFFFATVSSRMVGTVGSSNNPVSGMAIATLLFATALLKIT